MNIGDIRGRLATDTRSGAAVSRTAFAAPGERCGRSATATRPSGSGRGNGGTYYKSGSDSKCVYPEVTTKPGNMPDGYDGGAKTTTQETIDGNGNLTNRQTDTTTCTGHKCPK